MIFGTLHSKFIYNGNEVELPYSVMKPNYLSANYVEHKSIINGDKNFITLGDSSEFSLIYYLFKDNASNYNFNELLKYLHKEVIFYPHKNGTFIKDLNEEPILFNIIQIEPIWLFNNKSIDAINFSFVSTKFNRLFLPEHRGYGFDYAKIYGYSL